MTTDRCPTCDKPRAGDVAVSHADGCSCPDCLSVCWRDWGVLCKPADWRARAIAAEAKLAAADKAIEDVAEELETLRDDIAEYLPAYDIGDDMQPCLANPREVVEYAGDELRRASKDAARWRKVAPLIEAMREAAKVAHHDYATEDDATVGFRVTGHELIDAVTNLLAATKEP